MRPRQYEGMFLFDSAFAAEASKPEAEIKRILDRADAELVFCRKWDERRLAYEIAGRKRGTYMLTYFKCRPDAVAAIERDVRLSESVLRVLVLKAEHVTPEQMNAFVPEQRAAAAPREDAGPSDREKGPADAPATEAIEPEAEPVVLSAGSDGGDVTDP